MAVVMSFKVRDAENKTKTVPVHMPTSASYADIATFAASMATFLDAMISARVDSAQVCLDIDLSSATRKANPLANSRVGVGGTLSFLNSAGVAYSQFIPALIDAALVGGKVNEAETNVAQWISGMLNGGASADPCDLSQLDLTSFTGGIQSTRK